MDTLITIAAIAILIVVIFAVGRWTGRYLRRTKEDAHKLLKMAEPSQAAIEETIKDLSRFPRDKEVTELIELLIDRRSQP